MYYGHVVEVRAADGGIVNRVPFVPGQQVEEKPSHREEPTYNEVGAIKRAKRLISRWNDSEQFTNDRLSWKVVR